MDQKQIEFRQRHGWFPKEDEYNALRRELGPRSKPPFKRYEQYLPVWKLVKGRNLTVDQALGELARCSQEFDRRDAQRGVKRLEELMSPIG